MDGHQKPRRRKILPCLSRRPKTQGTISVAYDSQNGAIYVSASSTETIVGRIRKP